MSPATDPTDPTAPPAPTPLELDRRSFLQTLGALSLAPTLAWAAGGNSPAAPAAGRRLRIYQPSVRNQSIYFSHPGHRPFLKYNHDVDIVRFRGRFVAAWNGNAAHAEDVPGQFNYLSLSDNFQDWSPPVRMFSAEAGARNAVESDNQWQPNFINWRDETLFCAWSDFVARRVYVAVSRDGRQWENREVANAPAALAGQACGFPTNHGLVTSKGILLFPCSLPFTDTRRAIVGKTRFAGVLRSEDQGRTWSWSEPIEAVSWSETGENPAEFGGELITLWEPMLYEQADGRIGLLIRNSTAQENPERQEKPYRMLLRAVSSDEGRTWTRATTVEVETICSRCYATAGVGSPDSLLMVMNDNNVRVPQRISHDRYYLSLYCSPVSDPDLLLPGPIVQAPGGAAFYPNGFTADGKLYLGYTYPLGIHSSVVEPLPDFSAPFLLPRGGRPGLFITGSIARFTQRQSSLGLVLTEPLTRQRRLQLDFRLAVNRYDGSDRPILTLGGMTRNGTVIRAVYVEARQADWFQVKQAEDRWLDLAPFALGAWNHFAIELSETGFSVAVNEAEPLALPTRLLRKICFGGLYVAPEWPVGMKNADEVQLDLDSIVLT
jgi:hypothetical protein